MEVKPEGEEGKFAWKVTKQDVKELPADSVEAELKAGIEKQTSTKIESIKCPQGMKPEKAKVYECKVTVQGGGDETILVKPTGEGGKYDSEIKRG